MEHVWNAFVRLMASRVYPLGNTWQLKQMLIEEWKLLAEELLDNLVLSTGDGDS